MASSSNIDATLFPNLAPFAVPTSTDPPITIRGIHSSNTSLPPLVLLHGFPQTHAIWHRVAPTLSSSYHVIIPDLRGYGLSDAAPASPDNAFYSKDAMALDVIKVAAALRPSGTSPDSSAPFFLVGHDRGARVSHTLALNHPAAVRRMILLDICPTLAMYDAADAAFAARYWHWFFLVQPHPLPERVMSAAPADWLRLLMGGLKNDPHPFFHPLALASYAAAFRRPESITAMCEDYRAARGVDCNVQAQDRGEGGRRIAVPLRVLWGKKGVIEMFFDALKEWGRVVEEGTELDGWAVDSGHYVPEEAPEEVLRAVREWCV
ncbi:Alpha/Beta hydrolase protein [Phyllosticta citrichinensis]|uniref:Alpha/Beta hydrolase protein n=1 Tax=Phyllosticta citrichinensis TaxID=1130410 RepID=A0ABR1XVF3_9PEZI